LKTDEKLIMNSIANEMIKFSQVNSFQNAVLNMMVHLLGRKEKLSKLRQLFIIMDQDKDGAISQSELELFMKVNKVFYLHDTRNTHIQGKQQFDWAQICTKLDAQG
jgi:Ca2+-binding EF-hand superfamily protein